MGPALQQERLHPKSWDAIIRRLLLVLLLALSACGGGSSSPTSPGTATPTPTPTPTATAGVANVAAVILDAGPASLGSANAAFNTPFVTITICAPGSTTNCQTIDHVILDTGSVGLRIIQPVINASLLTALPPETDTSGQPVGECYQYVASYAFGSVRQVDFSIAGETVRSMPVQIIGDTGTFANVPSACSSGGGSAITTVNSFGANAIIGIGSTGTDCGTICQAGQHTGAIYYDCPASGCAQIIARTASTVAPFEQLPNPVAAFATDNNGTILTLPAVPQAGVASLSGTITFGIGTQPDNSLTAATLLTLTTSQSNLGPGLLTATFNGATLQQSYVDSGSTVYFFEDSSLVLCPANNFNAFYCPASPLALSPIITGQNGVSGSAAFTLYNPTTLRGNVTVAPGLGVDPLIAFPKQADPASFDVGIPFYFGRTVYTAIEGANAGGTLGPYVAF
ncbi:MAG: DUF3443 domain-containing protein [Pseudomonadota bacterium]|nr:DUF3443 domain-containing protein [Pseudomonadota bacterium]